MARPKTLTPWKRSKQTTFSGVPSMNGRWGYPAVAPFFIIFLIFGVAPVIYSVYISFFKWEPLGETEFNGVNNFVFLLQDSDFWIALRNTFSIWALSTFPQLIMALGLAWILRNRRLKAKSFWRTILPDELYESASVDGASRWQQFIYVTLPQLKNTITFVLIVGTIGGLQVFAEPQQLRADGGSSKQFLTLTLFLYNQAFLNNKYGYAAAVGIAITVIVLIISAINFFIVRRIASESSS